VALWLFTRFLPALLSATKTTSGVELTTAGGRGPSSWRFFVAAAYERRTEVTDPPLQLNSLLPFRVRNGAGIAVSAWMVSYCNNPHAEPAGNEMDLPALRAPRP